jgi:hypothetical protein
MASPRRRDQAPVASFAVGQTERYEAVFRDKSAGDTIRDFRKSGEFQFGRQRPGIAETP